MRAKGMTNNSINALGVSSKPKLDYLWIELTNRCNLSCKHCYSNSGPDVDISQELSHEDHKKVLRDAAELGCKSVQFIGGEPTLYPHLKELVCFANGIGFNDIEVFTNLVTLKDDILKLVADGIIRIATSFYSSDQSVHGNITGSENSFKHTVKNIGQVVSAGGEVRACVPLMESNLKYRDETFNYLNRLGVEQVQSDAVREFGRASPSAKECMESLCGACAGNVACISPEGKVSPCIMSKKWSLGDLKTTDLADILSCGTTKNTRRNIEIAVSAKIEKNGTSCLPVTCLPQGPDCLPKLCLPRSPGIKNKA